MILGLLTAARSDRKVVLESADLLYRLEELLKARGIRLERVSAELKDRSTRSTRIAKAVKRKRRQRAAASFDHHRGML